MPRYEFLREKCKKPFELVMTIAERGQAKVKCLGISVRIEPFETPAIGGGRCMVRGDHLILIDAQAPIRERITALARALSRLENERDFMALAARAIAEAMKESALEG